MTPPLFHFLIFLLEFGKYILRPYFHIVYRSHKEYAKDKNNTNETIWVFYLSILFEYSIWVFYLSILLQVKPNKRKKEKSTCVALYFWPVLLNNTVYYRGISSFVRVLMNLFDDAVME